MNKEEKKQQDYLQKMKFKEPIALTNEDIKASFAKIKERIDLPTDVVLPKVKKMNLCTTVSFRIAASIAIVLTLIIAGYNYIDSNKQILVANNNEMVQSIVLPDGSLIALRSNSTLTYRNNFEKNRTIELSGEALFEVVKDQKHPFTVETKNGNVTVLGTVFTVRAYEHEAYTKTLLKEGSVKFEDSEKLASVFLTPGEEARLAQGEKQIKVRKVTNIERELAWKTHNFSFDNESLETILSVISDAFNKKLELKNSAIATKKYSLKFNRDETLPQMLEVLSEVAKFNYKIEKSVIVVE
ncbi:MAG: hypothetical protein AUK44_06995 [Porphyromonadaceae bacterium CG2_30_38_12]|nr:MAG: hypothetical protein AUK44_06995 [Porphyromonadaceae bacterium CG2_30_38_12]